MRQDEPMDARRNEPNILSVDNSMLPKTAHGVPVRPHVRTKCECDIVRQSGPETRRPGEHVLVAGCLVGNNRGVQE